MTINNADIKHTRQEQTKNIIDQNIKVSMWLNGANK